MKGEPDCERRDLANRWARLAAVMIDVVLLYWLLRGVGAILLALGVYVPFEVTYLVAYLLGTALLIGWVGTTPGRWLCGIAIRTRSGEPVGFGRAALRELVAKPLAVVPLLLAYLCIRLLLREAHLWLLLSGTILFFVGLAYLVVHVAMGLHDRIAHTMVIRTSGSPWPRVAVAAGLTLPVVLLGGWAVSNLLLYLDIKTVVPEKLADVRFAGRDSLLVTDVATIDSSRDANFVAWLDTNAMPPMDFAVAKCRQYPLVLFGEEHMSHDILSFVADALPRLHSEAGIRCLGMESINSEDDAALERLMAGETFDEALAIEIYRNQSWHSWGGRGYVDVLRAAWRVNRDRAPGEPRFRVVGLDEPFDMPSLALAGSGSDRVPAPLVERLRIGRVLRDLPRAMLRDVYMAREAERQMLERGDRGVVLVGANHTSIGALAPYLGLHGDPRMGFILGSKYPGKVYQISFSSYGVGRFIGRVMGKRGNAPVGFEVRNSPFDLIRASDKGEYRGSPAVAFGDLAAGYIYLVSPGKGSTTPWVSGFVTPAMFARYHPFYEAKWGGGLRGPADIDSVMSRAGH